MAHTPGPYSRYTGEGNDTISVTKWIDGPNGGKMAISLAKMPLPGKHLSQEQINANARLFESAPDLLATLKSVREFVKAELDVRVDSHTLDGELMGFDYDGPPIITEARECLERIDAALARAEGHAP